jgi:hypothetical protein
MIKRICIDYKDIVIDIMVNKIDYIEYNYKDKAVVISINNYLRGFYNIDETKYQMFSNDLDVFLNNELDELMRFDFNNKDSEVTNE